MRTAEDVREYLEGASYPARPEDLIATAQANGAPPSKTDKALDPPRRRESEPTLWGLIPKT